MLSVQLTANSDTLVDLTDSLERILQAEKAHPQCKDYSLHQSVSNPLELLLKGEWQTQDAMIEHVRSEEFRVVLAAIDLSAVKPDIRFDKVLSSEGLEYLQGLTENNHL